MRLFRRGLDEDRSSTGDLCDWRSNDSRSLLNSGQTGRVGKAKVGKARKIIQRVLSISSIFASLRIWPEWGSAWDFYVVASKEPNAQ
jgi:hypothetical protein